MTDLEIVFNAIKAKQLPQDKLFRYYNGDQPAVYSSNRLRDVFKNIDTVFSENWCSVVVDCILDRINLERIGGRSEAETNLLSELWLDRDMDDEAHETHKSALIAGEAFVIVWPDENGHAEAYFNDPRKCHAQPDAENPKRIGWAGKMWRLDSGEWRINLYYPDRVEKYITAPMDKDSAPDSSNSFMQFEIIANPYQKLPVFYFHCQSELTNILSPQIAVNKLLNDMIIASEFGALKQRYVISEAETGTLKNAPNEIWSLPEGSEVGELSASDLSNFINAMDREVNVISTISKIPKHYFINQGGMPSGEALIAMEAGINKKAGNYIRRFKKFWSDVIEMMLEIENIAIDKKNISPLYEAPETVQPRTRAEIIQIETNSGIPLVTSLRRKDWSEADIKAMLKDKDEAQERETTTAKVLLENARKQTEQMND